MSTIGVSAKIGSMMKPSPAPPTSSGAIVGVANIASVNGEKNTHRNAIACGNHRRRLSLRAAKIAEAGIRTFKTKTSESAMNSGKIVG
ncbi:hypothetical protein [Rhizobium anhuiense]|uniref:hypothetical protein n=1 Tax=Rhizobium anhuiense TaxID=1184720 RepID=UPI0006478EBC|nr:hypothetical protein [Rhizobium anhuiense]UTS89740.1 DUF3827 domain-containing protein [Rhizobium anhuiense bv. trifolii]